LKNSSICALCQCAIAAGGRQRHVPKSTAAPLPFRQCLAPPAGLPPHSLPLPVVVRRSILHHTPATMKTSFFVVALVLALACKCCAPQQCGWASTTPQQALIGLSFMNNSPQPALPRSRSSCSEPLVTLPSSDVCTTPSASWPSGPAQPLARPHYRHCCQSSCPAAAGRPFVTVHSWSLLFCCLSLECSAAAPHRPGSCPASQEERHSICC
jgi:hypothetical protein